VIHVERILYPTDFSSYSNQAYFHAVALAKAHGAALTIMYVIDPGKGGPTPDGVDARSYWGAQLEQIRPIDESIPVIHVLAEGDPAEQIVGRARADRMSLVVMGTHGRTGLERLLMGSVAERVLREAPCSVLIVKIPRAR